MYNFNQIAIVKMCGVIGLGLILASCGGSSNGDAESGSGTASFTLGITDAPVDGADNVFVRFTGVELLPSENGSEPRVITFTTPKTIDLLDLQGGVREFLLNGEQLPAVRYGQIRLMVQAEHDNVMDSYIVVNGAQHELRIPSGNQTGLKLIHNFELMPDSSKDLTIDFDLRKSVVFAPGNGYMLKPVLRLIDTPTAGKITGTVSPAIFASQACSGDPLKGYGVYLYSGTGITSNDLGSTTAPVATTTVTLNQSSLYVYTLGFVAPGSYTISATCTADQDDPEKDDSVSFGAAANVTVTANTTTTHNF